MEGWVEGGVGAVGGGGGAVGGGGGGGGGDAAREMAEAAMPGVVDAREGRPEAPREAVEGAS